MLAGVAAGLPEVLAEGAYWLRSLCEDSHSISRGPLVGARSRCSRTGDKHTVAAPSAHALLWAAKSEDCITMLWRPGAGATCR